MELHSKLLRDRKLKIIYTVFAIFLTFIAGYLPDFKDVIGIEGVRISSAGMFGPLNGMLLGPFYGALASFIGVFSYNMLNGYTKLFNYYTTLLVMFSSLIAGLILVKKEKIVLGIYSSLILIWFLFEVGREAFTTPWFHILVLIAFILFRRVTKAQRLQVNLYTFVFLFLVSLLALLAEHMAGDILALNFYHLTASDYNAVIFIYPVERGILAFLAATITFMIVAMIQHTVISAKTVEKDAKEMEAESLLKYVRDDVQKVLEEVEDPSDKK